MKYMNIARKLCFLCLCFIQADAEADSVRTYTTTADGNSRLEQTTTETNSSSGSTLIRISAEEKYQTIDGFGFALTYSSCYNLMKMDSEKRAELLRRTFSPEDGYGVSYVRISIGCNDFSSTLYTLCDRKGLHNFKLHTDETNYVIPILKEILAINPDLKIMAAPWTCPRWMKMSEDGSSTEYNSWTGGRLNQTYLLTYADYFVKFIQAFQQEGISIYAVTPQNEPLNAGNCASLLMPWNDEARLISRMAPQFKRAGLSTKIYCFDHNFNYDNKSDQENYPIKVYEALDSNMEGMELVAGSAWHDYGGNQTELEDIYRQAPDKELIFTESSIGEWNDGRNLKTRLIADAKWLAVGMLNRQCRAVMVWNLMLDMNQGPNLDGGCQTCYGALDIDQTDYSTITANSHYYVIAHTSVAASPGAVRLGTTERNADGLSHSAFRNTDGSYGVLVVNEGGAAKLLSVMTPESKYARVRIPAKSVMSIRIGGNESGIAQMPESTSSTDAVYDLSGKRLPKQATKGIYITKGRKFFSPH